MTRSERGALRVRTLALVVVGGVAWGLCFERLAMPSLAWVALVPACRLLESRRAGVACWAVGTVSWIVALRWIPRTVDVYGGVSAGLAALLLLPLALYLGAYLGLWAALGARLWHRGGASAWLGLPALWVALEWLRTYAFSGFPWNLAAYAWTEQPGALALAPWIGAYGISGVVLLANVGLARAWRARSVERAAATVLVALALLVTLGRLSPRPTWDAERAPEFDVAIVQPNIENQVGYDPKIARESYARLIELSEAACDGAPKLLLWPESATFPYTYSSEPRLRADLERLAGAGCSVLVNSVTRRGEDYFNSVLLIDERGHVATYDKRHLVPFGEYVPLAGVFGFIDSLTRNVGDFSTVEEPVLLPARHGEIGTALCYEIVFPEEVAAVVRRDAKLLVTLTNDAWYGDTAAPWQHFRAARFRAAESRRYVLRAAITGVSGIIDPYGRVVAELGVGELGVLTGRVEPRDDQTLHTHLPWGVPLASTLAALFAIFRCRGDRRSPAPR